MNILFISDFYGGSWVRVIGGSPARSEHLCRRARVGSNACTGKREGEGGAQLYKTTTVLKPPVLSEVRL